MEKIITKELMHAYCNNCSKEIDSVWMCKINSIIGVRYIYFCGECQKPLGVFHEKITNMNNMGTNFHLNGNKAQERSSLKNPSTIP